MRFTPSLPGDIEQLSEWIQADPYHKDCLDPVWWLTGNGFLSLCVQDDHGPTMYARIDKEDGLMRLHVQFAPEQEVSKKRVIASLIWSLPKMGYLARQENLKGFIYRSTSPLLIAFMKREFGFESVGDDDFVLQFGVTDVRTK